jgi:hypothetical protein
MFEAMKRLLPCFLALMPLLAQTLEEKEAFLSKAPITRERASKKGITGTVRATLSDGAITHDASIQTINESKPKFEGNMGTEINFRDTYLFNIAAYRLGKLLGLGGMIPPSVSRSHAGNTGSYTWWIDNVLMDEGERLKQNTEAPDKDKWARQTLIMRVFDQLISNTDRNVGNILYDKDWNLWMIDHSRAFRLHHTLLNPKILDKCDRQFLNAMRKLNYEILKAELSSCLQPSEIRAILHRRDVIIAHFDKAGPEKQYDYLPSSTRLP